MSEQEGRQYLTKKETAELLGVEERTVDRYADSGLIKRYRQGSGLRRRVYFDRQQVREFKQERDRIEPEE